MRSYFIIAFLVIGIYSLQHFKHKNEMGDLRDKYEYDINLLNNKYQSMIKSLQEEYDKLETVYNKREDDNEAYKDKQKELMENISELEEFIKNNSGNPSITIEKLDESMQEYMGRVYEETNSNIISK